MEPLTEKQKRVWKYLQDVVSSRNYPPSVREICQAMGFKSSSTAHAYLSILEKKGYIRKDSTRPRAIELLVQKENIRQSSSTSEKNNALEESDITLIPVVGEVPAGEPLLAEQNIEDHFPLPGGYFTSEEGSFMLRVKGDSMTGAGINHGDLVVVNPSHAIQNGDIVVALLEDEATVKRFYKEEDRVRLQPENDNYSPTYHLDIKILGRVTGLFRKM